VGLVNKEGRRCRVEEWTGALPPRLNSCPSTASTTDIALMIKEGLATPAGHGFTTGYHNLREPRLVVVLDTDPEFNEFGECAP
jgi:hypothetical protein